MKKILLILALMILVVGVSACSTKKASEETTVSEGTNSEIKNNLVGDNNIVTPVPSDNSALTPVDSTSSASSENTSQSANLGSVPVDNKNMIDQKSFSDLTKEYSQALIKTSMGDIKVKFYNSDSPFTVNNFLNLAKAGFYNGTKFHRVIKDFMIQGGDPLSKEANASLYGTGGPGYQFKDEFNSHKLVEGSLAMANSGPGTNGSQFFIVTLNETPWLDGKHTNFGQVVSGMDIVKKIEATPTGTNDKPVTDVVVKSIELMK